MNSYQDKSKQDKIKNLMHLRTPVSFQVLQQLSADDILEDYDTFDIVSDQLDMKMYYLGGNFYMIDKFKRSSRMIPEELLSNRYFVLERSVTNNVQGFLQKKGREAFEQLTDEELIDVIQGIYIRKKRFEDKER